MTLRNSLFALLMIAPLAVNAQTADSPTMWIDNTLMVAVGSQNELDTYLSSQEYSGFTARFVSHTVRSKEGKRWSTRIVHQGEFFTGDMKQSSDGNALGGLYNFQWGKQYRIPLSVDNISLKVGATLDATLGFLYNTRNSNNPAQARVALNASPVVTGQWRFSMWQKTFALNLELTAPLCGLRFSPNYGQSYYEIFSRGDYDHNCVPTTFIATPSLSSMLTLDIPVGSSALRIGYIGDFQQVNVNNIKQHSYSHYFVVGYSRSFTVVKRKAIREE